ncbi:kinesin-like protein KIN-12F isoform X1 [Lactuca sativa]|uniref:kinesin-like protein KIN-12F isoform X1 n=1 Tax=Lactuca sativa TaxID=4236 RepID=UPI0022AFD604|nr:kinesin-like protein KIN-12F isoform X1 [Lactuca sativa]XP_052625342.1 kinesin-like protein KIN-12F isoform X1 [Lactuca sativa]
MELAKVQEANKRMEMELVQLETNLIEMETLVESRTCELLEVRKELEMSQAPAEENEAIATESKQLLKQVDCMVTVLENQVSLFFNWKLALYCKTLYKYWQPNEVAGLESTNKW